MGLDNFLVPVLGGYLLLRGWTYTKYQAERLTGYHLILHSTAMGVALWLVASLATQVLENCVPSFYGFVQSVLPGFATFDQLVCIFFGFIFPFIGNPLVSSEERTRELLEQYGDDVEKLIDEAVRDIELVEVTTKSRKIYVGVPLESNLLSRKDSGIALIPFASGYRSESTLKLVFTTWYADVIEQAVERGELVDELQMRIVLPFQQIVSVRKFIPETYLRFIDEAEDST